MRVRFSPEALADAAAHRHLTAAFWACQDRGHDWWVDDPQALRGSAWLKAEGVAVREDIERLANASARRGRGSPVRTLTLDSLGASTDVAANGDVHAPADLGAQWLSRPLRIVVENAQCDGRLVRLVLLRTGERRLRRRLGDTLTDHIRTRWIEGAGDGEVFCLVHGGGDTTAAQATVGPMPPAGVPPRTFVMVDSDLSAPPAQGGRFRTGGTADKVDQAIQALPAQVRPGLWVLRKRAVENYVPEDALKLEYWQRYGEYEALSTADRDFADLKSLFGSRTICALLEWTSPTIHDRSLRDRAGDGGRELDQMLDALLSAL